MTDVAPLITAISSLVGTSGVLVLGIVGIRTSRNLARNTSLTQQNNTLAKATHEEVKSINGQSGTELLEAAEGRRIEADVPAEDRTHAEQAYVDRLDPDGTSSDR